MQNTASENTPGRTPGRRLLGHLAFVLFTLLAAALLILAALRLHPFDAAKNGRTGAASGFEVTEESDDTARIYPCESSDIGEIRKACGFPLPCFPGQGMYGEAYNVSWMGKNAVRVTMEYPGGVVIEAVRPAAAAALIKRDGMEVRLYESLRVPFAHSAAGPAALLCTGKGGSCMYYSTDSAAYSIYAPVDGDTLYTYIKENDLGVR